MTMGGCAQNDRGECVILGSGAFPPPVILGSGAFPPPLSFWGAKATKNPWGMLWDGREDSSLRSE